MSVSRLPKADQDLYDQLHSKYRGRPTTQVTQLCQAGRDHRFMISFLLGLQEQASTSSAVQHQPTSASQGQVTEDVSVCAACQGSKVEVELYHFRKLEVSSDSF